MFLIISEELCKISLIYISEDFLETRVFTIYIFSIMWYTVAINLKKGSGNSWESGCHITRTK